MQWLHVLADVGVETRLELLNQLPFDLVRIALTTNDLNDGNVKSIGAMPTDSITEPPVMLFGHSTLDMFQPTTLKTFGRTATLYVSDTDIDQRLHLEHVHQVIAVTALFATFDHGSIILDWNHKSTMECEKLLLF
jgi:hypothetical protein